MDKDLSTKEYGNVKTVLQGMIRYARFEKKYTSINISNFFGDFRVGKNILKKSEKTDAQKCFTDEERIRILKLVDKKPDIRNLAIHLCFQTGVRVGELAARNEKILIGKMEHFIFSVLRLGHSLKIQVLPKRKVI